MTDDSAPVIDPTPEPIADASAPASLAAVRDLILLAHPNVVPELVVGDSFEALIESVGPATEAYGKLASRFEPAATTEPPVVPAGASAPMVLDPDRLPAAEKIRLGIRERADSAGQSSR